MADSGRALESQAEVPGTTLADPSQAAGDEVMTLTLDADLLACAGRAAAGSDQSLETWIADAIRGELSRTSTEEADRPFSWIEESGQFIPISETVETRSLPEPDDPLRRDIADLSLRIEQLTQLWAHASGTIQTLAARLEDLDTQSAAAKASAREAAEAAASIRPMERLVGRLVQELDKAPARRDHQGSEPVFSGFFRR